MRQGWRSFPDGVLMGDSIYPLKTRLIPPVVGNPNDPSQRRFRIAYKRTCSAIERAIGILKEKFPCLTYLRLKLSHAAQVVICSVVLCNITKKPVTVRVNNVPVEDDHDVKN